MDFWDSHSPAYLNSNDIRNLHRDSLPSSDNTSTLQESIHPNSYVPTISQTSPTVQTSSPPHTTFNPSPNLNWPRTTLPPGESPEHPSPTRTSAKLSSKADKTLQTHSHFVQESTNSSSRMSNSLSQVFEVPRSNTSENWPAISAGGGNAARTGRVIERLGKELDWSKREISLLNAKLEEEQQRSESSKLSLESARASAMHYESMYDQAQRTITRKDRKLADIKTELETERSKRIKAEKERDSTVSQSQRDMAKEKEIARFASTQYETLKDAISGKEAFLQRECARIRLEFDELKQQRQLDLRTLEKLESLSSEVCKKQDVMDNAHLAIISNLEIYKDEKDKSLQQMVERAREVLELGDLLAAEMRDTLGKMRHVVNVKESFLG